MALAMAREAKLPANETGARPCVVYASEQVHMSIAKAIALIGIGRNNLRLVPVDDAFRMRTDALEAAIAADRKPGNTPIAIVATVGSVNTGAIDPLQDAADIARREALWLHVDGAYGGLAALAAPETSRACPWPIPCRSTRTNGCISRSIAAAFSIVTRRSRARRFHSGDYVKVPNQDPIEALAFFDESIELSRRFRALKLWMSLKYHGRRAFREAIARDLEHAQMLAQAVASHRDLQLLAPVSLSAVCFCHRTKDNQAILRRVVARGRVYLSNAAINGEFALRACFVNHRTNAGDVRSSPK